MVASVSYVAPVALCNVALRRAMFDLDAYFPAFRGVSFHVYGIGRAAGRLRPFTVDSYFVQEDALVNG